MFAVNRSPTQRDLRWFAAGMLVGFPAVATIIWYASGGTAASIAIVVISGLLATIGIAAGFASLASAQWGRKLYVAWMTITLPIGLAMSTLLLTVLYFVLLPPFSLIVRRKDPLRKKLGAATYWEDYKPHEATLERMRRPF